MKRRIEASDAFVAGDVGPLLAVSATASPATIFPPPRRLRAGRGSRQRLQRRGRGVLRAGQQNSFEIMPSGAPLPMALRITEIFRKDDGEWKLIHRHADPFKG